jgi:5-methylcytosine-specific restriction endonuclease McrA
MPEPDFIKRFTNYIQIARKEDREKQYITNVEPFLQEVADELSVKYANQKLYPHISNFRTHVLLRLGPDKKMTHRASIGVLFSDDYVNSGFDLTHALGDAHQLRMLFREKTNEIANEILKLQDHSLWMPNAGITQFTPISNLSLLKLKRTLLRYDPEAMRECYIHIKRDYTARTLSKKQLVNVFVKDRNRFAFLLDEILVENKAIVKDVEPVADEDTLQQKTRQIRKSINLVDKPVGQQQPKKIATLTTAYFRDPSVRAWVLENANGKCEACRSDAPFFSDDGYPFLEVHHMISLAVGGPDTIENTIALCPNCHRRCHLSNDREVFIRQLYKKVIRLNK